MCVYQTAGRSTSVNVIFSNTHTLHVSSLLFSYYLAYVFLVFFGLLGEPLVASETLKVRPLSTNDISLDLRQVLITTTFVFNVTVWASTWAQRFIVHDEMWDNILWINLLS